MRPGFFRMGHLKSGAVFSVAVFFRIWREAALCVLFSVLDFCACPENYGQMLSRALPLGLNVLKRLHLSHEWY
jgi:hypothetical protein